MSSALLAADASPASAAEIANGDVTRGFDGALLEEETRAFAARLRDRAASARTRGATLARRGAGAPPYVGCRLRRRSRRPASGATRGRGARRRPAGRWRARRPAAARTGHPDPRARALGARYPDPTWSGATATYADVLHGARIQERFTDRFIECGIAEQDMVSQASGLALAGMLPVCHSFACFLSTRPNEQIYNQATEKTRVVYVGSLAGVVPGGPGHSHQSVRDIATLASVPNLALIEPSCEAETAMATGCAEEGRRLGLSASGLDSVPDPVPPAGRL